MKAAAHEYEPNEENHLEDKPSDNNRLADVGGLWVGQKPGTVSLDVEAHEVANDENASGTARRDQRECSAVLDGAHDARIDHVHRGGEEDGREKEERPLQDVEGKGAGHVVGYGAGYVPKYFTCGQDRVSRTKDFITCREVSTYKHRRLQTAPKTTF